MVGKTEGKTLDLPIIDNLTIQSINPTSILVFHFIQRQKIME